VKRRLRAVLAARLQTLPPGLLVVVRANPAAAAAASATLAGDVDSALARLGRSFPAIGGLVGT
jgi:ribonuclease P protein component